MKKLLQKIKAFFTKLKLAFVKAWEDLKTALKQSREKVQAKEKKPNKGSNKVLKVVVIIYALIFLAYNITTCSVRRDCTAKADVITGDVVLTTPVVTVPYVLTYYDTNFGYYFVENVTIPPFYLSFTDISSISGASMDFMPSSFWLVGGDDGSLGYNKFLFEWGSEPYSTISLGRRPLLQSLDSGTPNRLLWSFANCTATLRFPSMVVPVDYLNSIYDVRQTFVRVRNVFSFGFDTVRYEYRDVYGNVVFTLDVSFGYSADGDTGRYPYGLIFPTETPSETPIKYNPTTLRSFVFTPPFSMGEDFAYEVGFSAGYKSGLEDGLDDNFSVFDSIFSAVDSFLDIELFDGFKISTLLYIGFGLLLVGFVIKVFLGG